jgi:hypothetical protein
VAASDGEMDGDEEQKSAMLLVDLSAAAKSELAPARFLVRMSGDEDEGRRRVQGANATLAPAIIPAPALVRGGGRRSRPSAAGKVLSEAASLMLKPISC